VDCGGGGKKMNSNELFTASGRLESILAVQITAFWDVTV
jgi:hypothetical protein